MDKLSIVVPCYNEQETVNIFYRETTKVVDAMKMDYEIIFVNDGSRDKTLEELTKLHDAHPEHVIVIDFFLYINSLSKSWKVQREIMLR